MFAYNGEAHDAPGNTYSIDYVKMAVANAKSIKKYMHNHSVALVTAVSYTHLTLPTIALV